MFHIPQPIPSRVTAPITIVIIIVTETPLDFSTANATQEKMNKGTLPSVRRKVTCLVLDMERRKSLDAVGEVASIREAM